MIELKSSAVGYIAALFDMHGSCRWTSRTCRPKHVQWTYTYESLALKIRLRGRVPLDFVQQTLRLGAVYRCKKSTLGVTTPHLRHGEAYRWQATGQRAISAARLLLPYLQLRRDEVESALLAAGSGRTVHGRTRRGTRKVAA